MLLLRKSRRQRLARACSQPEVAQWLSTEEPGLDSPLSELSLLAIDVETTGLSARQDTMLSVGLVPIDGESIVLGGAESFLLKPGSEGRGGELSGVGQSAVVHRLTDDALAEGLSAAEALDRIAVALTGRILLAHYATLEVGFIRSAFHRVYGIRPPITAVDTLSLQHRLVSRSLDTPPRPDELRLWAARERFGLPPVQAHDALSDALACAELYLAQCRELQERGATRLSDLGPT